MATVTVPVTVLTDCPVSGIAAGSVLALTIRTDRFGRRFCDAFVQGEGSVWVQLPACHGGPGERVGLYPQRDTEYGTGLMTWGEVATVTEGDWAPAFSAYVTGESFTRPVLLGLHFTAEEAMRAAAFVGSTMAEMGC